MKKLFLLPGKLLAFNEPTEIKTFLGSCVSVVLVDKEAKCMGLNHYLLPKKQAGERDSARYGECAIPMLIKDMLELGASKENLEAHVFGGANILGDLKIGIEIGQKNINCAQKILEGEGIPIVQKFVGGRKSRRIVVNSEDFTVKEVALDGYNPGAVDNSGYQKLKEKKKVKVLIVDDSATIRTLFQNIFSKNDIEVVGVAADAYRARELIVREKPDVVTLDIEMPKMNGVVFLEKLMRHMPMPVVMVSSLGSQGEAALKSLSLGAVEFIHKPTQYDPQILKQLGEMLVLKVKAAANARVMQLGPERAQEIHAGYSISDKREVVISGLNVIAVGGNTGSQKSLEVLLKSLPADTPPVVVSNCTVSGFLDAYLKKLGAELPINLKIAAEGELLKEGNVYFAPAETHLKVVKQTSNYVVKLDDGMPVNGQKPSIDVLFSSVAESAKGRSLGILLSGFGRDGVDGLSRLHSAGSQTMVQEPSTCAYPYAPQQAISSGVVDFVKESSDFVSTVMEVRNRSVA